MDNVMEILDMMQFFGGQRAGRELWADKPMDVQNADIEAFNNNIEAIREYIKQLEVERDAAVDHVRGDCAYCTYLPGETIPDSCFDCANKGYYRWEFRGAQKEG